VSRNENAQLDGYVRVSRLGGRGEENLSTEEQRKRIEGYCQAHGHSVGEWFVETDESGGKSERPVWQRALARVEAGESGGVICAKLDRFARSAADGLAAVRRIEQAGGTFVSVAENFDSSSPYGRFTMTIFLALAELELGRIRDGWALAQSAAVARGVHISARVPAGYLRNGDGRLEPDPASSAHVREVFLRRAQGGSWQQLVGYLNFEQVPTFSGGQWTPGSVRAIVSNPVYKGEARGAQGLVNPEGHEPIVSKAQWRAANRRRGEKPVSRGEGKLLSGLVCCGSCGGRMSADSNRHGSFYRCRNRIVSVNGCPRPATISGNLIEPYVVEAALERLPTLAHKPPGSDGSGAAELEQALAAAEANLAEFVQAWQAEGVSPATAAKVLAQLERERDEAIVALAAIAQRPSAQEWLTVPPEKLRELLFEQIEGGILGNEVKLQPRDVPTVREFLRDFLIERALVQPGRGPVEQRVQIEFKPHPLAA
jgi:DNA invertase Pin-like site-specific DNA recombinase